jgi:hypothetical protein
MLAAATALAVAAGSAALHLRRWQHDPRAQVRANLTRYAEMQAVGYKLAAAATAAASS